MSLFFFNDTATTEIYTLSLHDALPISRAGGCQRSPRRPGRAAPAAFRRRPARIASCRNPRASSGAGRLAIRSEEHTSELQSPCNLVCRLLLEKKKTLQSAADRGCLGRT